MEVDEMKSELDDIESLIRKQIRYAEDIYNEEQFRYLKYARICCDSSGKCRRVLDNSNEKPNNNVWIALENAEIIQSIDFNSDDNNNYPLTNSEVINHHPFDITYWSTDIIARSTILKNKLINYTQQDITNNKSSFRLIYILENTYRITDNYSLGLAIQLSNTLDLPLEITV
jgi:hypothetical protein